MIARDVIVGQVVQPADQLFGVADLSSVWVVGDVPEQIARRLPAGAIQLERRVGRIAVEDGRATGIVAGGETIEAGRVVVATADSGRQSRAYYRYTS